MIRMLLLNKEYNTEKWYLKNMFGYQEIFKVTATITPTTCFFYSVYRNHIVLSWLELLYLLLNLWWYKFKSSLEVLWIQVVFQGAVPNIKRITDCKTPSTT